MPCCHLASHIFTPPHSIQIHVTHGDSVLATGIFCGRIVGSFSLGIFLITETHQLALLSKRTNPRKVRWGSVIDLRTHWAECECVRVCACVWLPHGNLVSPLCLHWADLHAESRMRHFRWNEAGFEAWERVRTLAPLPEAMSHSLNPSFGKGSDLFGNVCGAPALPSGTGGMWWSVKTCSCLPVCGSGTGRRQQKFLTFKLWNLYQKKSNSVLSWLSQVYITNQKQFLKEDLSMQGQQLIRILISPPYLRISLPVSWMDHLVFVETTLARAPQHQSCSL